MAIMGNSVRTLTTGTAVSTASRAARQDGEHRREGLALLVAQRGGGVHAPGSASIQPRQDALARALTERHAVIAACTMFSAQPKPKLSSPSRSGGAAQCGGSAKAIRPGGCRARVVASTHAVVGRVAVLQPFGAASGPSAASAGASSALSRWAAPNVERAMRANVVAPGRHGLCQHRQVGARQAQAQLVEQPVAGLSSFAHQAGLDRRLQALGVAEAAHRQRRRGQPHQLQQGPWAVAAVRRLRISGRARARAVAWSCA